MAELLKSKSVGQMAYYRPARPISKYLLPEARIGRRSTRRCMMAPDRGFRVVRKVDLPTDQ
jgi:hypothetical protein